MKSRKCCFFLLLLFSKVSDVGQVWGWGYGGEGQLGLGSRVHMVSSPHLVPCSESAAHVRDWTPAAAKENKSSGRVIYKVTGNCVKAIACGGRHSAVITGKVSGDAILALISPQIIQFTCRGRGLNHQSKT